VQDDSVAPPVVPLPFPPSRSQSELPPVPPVPEQYRKNSLAPPDPRHSDSMDSPSPGTRNNSSQLDPYAGLDGAFGGYVTDAPQPFGEDKRGDEEDLLF
jgi:AP-2 complex subunit beta-1